MKTAIYNYTILFLLIIPFMSYDSWAQNNETENKASWLTGTWVGDGFGGTSEEVWSEPSEDGTIMGVYRHHDADGSLNFYEFMVLDQSGLRLKHFTPDLIGWETKEDKQTFPMVRVTDNTVELNGLVYKRISDNEMEIILKMDMGNGIETEVFKMTRKAS